MVMENMCLLHLIRKKIKEKVKKLHIYGSIWFTENNFEKIFYEKWLSGDILPKNRREKRKINTRKIFSTFEKGKTFYEKMSMFLVD